MTRPAIFSTGIYLLLWLTFLAVCRCHAGEISKADILATLRHQRQIVAQAQIDTTSALRESAMLTRDLATARAERDKWQAQDAADRAARVRAERERDALIWIFSVACGMTALSAARPALQVILMPWQLVALAGVFAGGFAGGFAIGRWALHGLAAFTPHLPF